LRQIQCVAAGPSKGAAKGGAIDMRTRLRGVFAALCTAVLMTFAASLLTPAMAMKSSSSNSSVHKKKKVGSSEVRTIQKALNQKGYKVKVNGKMNKQTRTAIKKFQSDRGLEATGRVDEGTLAELGIG
jgi:peptidoglycan hydrolase-like protein with peptidoglycan-binding domain